MDYQEAVLAWATKRLGRPVLEVKFEFDEGFACCGGRDPECYCSFAESPSASVMARVDKGRYGWTRIMDLEDFDFATVLKEILEA